MKRFESAKKCRWIERSIALIFVFGAQVFGSVYPRLDCGTYFASGELRRGSHGHYLLAVRADTTSRRELILLGGDFDEKMQRRGSRLFATVYLPAPTDGLERPFAFLQEISKQRPGRQHIDEIKLIRKEACGQMGKFRKR